MKITLDAGEMAVAGVAAAMRTAVNRTAGVTDGKVGPQSQYQTELDGIVGELAFCKWKNVCPDLSVSPRHGGVDAVVKGQRIDIKVTRRPDGNLICNIGKSADNVDVYILGIVKDNEVDFVGWAYARELINDDTVVNLGMGPTYVLPQSKLRAFKD